MPCISENFSCDARIIRFLRKHHVMTLSTCCDGQPWCAHAFYVLMEDDMALAFTSDDHTRHIREAMDHPLVAASVVLETRIIGKIQGIQMEGRILSPSAEQNQTITNAYLRRFPVASVMDTHFWLLQINSVKMTDNLLGFGKKLFWTRQLLSQK